jgi:hypothetical protein
MNLLRFQLLTLQSAGERERTCGKQHGPVCGKIVP